MRLLVIGHTYMEGFGRRKYQMLAEQFEDAEITILTPTYWPDAFRVIRGEPYLGLRLRIQPLPTWLPGFGSRYVFLPLSFARAVRQSQPDVVLVEQEPWAMVYLQALLTTWLVARPARAGFFTWANVARGLPAPFRMLERIALGATSFVVAGNQASIHLLRKRGYLGPIRLIPQVGVDLKEFGSGKPQQIRQDLALGADPVITFVGRLVPEKGLRTLVSALAAIQDLPWRGLLVGSGSLEQELRETARQHGIESRLVFAGARPQVEIPDYLACSSVLVLPSERTPRWQEQFGHVLIEAMAARVVVIGSSSGEIPNVIGDAGLVFTEGDTEGLAQQLRTVLCDEDLRCDLITRGMQRVQEHYSNEALAKQLHGFLATVARRPELTV